MLFPSALKNQKRTCNYIGISGARGEGLSYYVLSIESNNGSTLLMNQIFPPSEAKCMYPQTVDRQVFLLCDTTGVLSKTIQVKSNNVINNEMACIVEDHYF